MEKKILVISFTLWLMFLSGTGAKYHLHPNKLEYAIFHPNKFQKLWKSESNFIDHGPIHPIKYNGNQKERKISWRSNTLHDNDDFQLQDLSLDGYGIQSNHYVISNNNFKADEGKKKEHIQGENIHRSITKKGKETKTDVMDDRMQVQSKSSYISNKMKNPNMSANNMKKTKKYYYNKQKYNKYERNKMKKQEYYGWMKYMKP